MKKALILPGFTLLMLFGLVCAWRVPAASYPKASIAWRSDGRTREDVSAANARERRDSRWRLPSGHTLAEIEQIEEDTFDEVNRERKYRGLESLAFDPDLLEVARNYSRRMAEEGFFSHKDPNGNTVIQRVAQAGIKWRLLGENLAYERGYVSPAAITLSGWMDSPGHRKNILDPRFDRSAIGAWISNDGTVYFTEILMKD